MTNAAQPSDQDIMESLARYETPQEPDWKPGQPPLIKWANVARIFEGKAAARRHPSAVDLCRTCAIFDLTDVDQGRWNELLVDEFSLGSPLPFPTIAVHLGWRVIIVNSMWIVDGDEQRVGAEILGVGVPFTEHKDAFSLIVSGTVEHDLIKETKIIEAVGSRVWGGKVASVDFDTDELRPYSLGEASGFDHENALYTFFCDALAALNYINQPHLFIVEEAARGKQSTRAGKIPRQHARAMYTVVDKTAIQTRYRNAQPDSERKSPVPHLRRGHYRTLTSARYKEPGKKVWVRATDVAGNDVRWREGDRQYRVI